MEARLADVEAVLEQIEREKESRGMHEAAGAMILFLTLPGVFMAVGTAVYSAVPPAASNHVGQVTDLVVARVAAVTLLFGLVSAVGVGALMAYVYSLFQPGQVWQATLTASVFAVITAPPLVLGSQLMMGSVITRHSLGLASVALLVPVAAVAFMASVEGRAVRQMTERHAIPNGPRSGRRLYRDPDGIWRTMAARDER